MVLDNLREGVVQPHIYDPALTPLYRDVLAHYGAIAMPCRVRDPDRKGKVESAVAHAQQKIKGLRFESIDAAQAYVDRWEERWADTRIHGTTKRQVSEMFEEEKPALLVVSLEVVGSRALVFKGSPVNAGDPLTVEPLANVGGLRVAGFAPCQRDGFHHDDIRGHEERGQVPPVETLEFLYRALMISIVLREEGVEETGVDKDHASS